VLRSSDLSNYRDEFAIVEERQDFPSSPLNEHVCDPNPFVMFSEWFNLAQKTIAFEPNAMALATCNREGFPSSRMVLLKCFDDEGFVFVTNYRSRKSREIEENPNVALCIYWKELKRAIRIEGVAQKTSAKESDSYFKARPKGQLLLFCQSLYNTYITLRTGVNI
jgi:pyridoxamine 5'-phosphate oxidase